MPRRSLCRALFLVVCIAPTLAIASWSAVRLADNGIAAQLEQLGDQLGLLVECQQGTIPRPGVWRLSGIVLREPESRTELARVDQATVFVADGDLVVQGDEVNLSAKRLQSLAGVIDRVSRQQKARDVTLAVDRVSLLEDSDEHASWSCVRAKLRALPGGPEVGRELELRAGPNGQELRLRVTRNRQVDPPATRVSLHTGEAGIAWRWLAGLMPGELNHQATFHGHLDWTTAGSTPHGRLQGSISGVDASAFFAGRDHGINLRQPARLRMHRLEWQGACIASLKATIQAGRGEMARSLVFAANSQLRCGPSQRLRQLWQATPDQAIAFDQLAFELRLDASGLQIRGACCDPAGISLPCVMVAQGEPLLYHPADERLPLLAALSFFAPPEAMLRPAGQEADALARRLPWGKAPTSRR